MSSKFKEILVQLSEEKGGKAAWEADCKKKHKGCTFQSKTSGSRTGETYWICLDADGNQVSKFNPLKD